MPFFVDLFPVSVLANSAISQVPSVQHYLAVLWDKRRVIHHRRTADGGIATHILADEAVRLDSPGILLDGIFPPA